MLPLIGSDCGRCRRCSTVTTMDLNNIPKTEDGKVDFSKDFFNKPTNLTVSGQLNGETYATGVPQHLYVHMTSVQKTPILPLYSRILDD